MAAKDFTETHTPTTKSHTGQHHDTSPEQIAKVLAARKETPFNSESVDVAPADPKDAGRVFASKPVLEARDQSEGGKETRRTGSQGQRP